jgi:hypothetical protein
MSLIDDRGRLFGRVNLVDAAVLAFVGMLVPLAYASYLLFRTPPATLDAVEPTSMVLGNNPRIRITGTNLRPFMRVSFNDRQGRTFLIGSTTSAEIDVPELDPGTYDLVLFDYAQELSRLPKAFTVLPPTPAPTAKLVASGAFIGLTSAQAAALTPGSRFATTAVEGAELLAVGDPAPSTARIRSGGAMVHVALDGQVEVPATLRLTCWLDSNPDGSLRCVTSGPRQQATVTPDAIFSVVTPGGEALNFQVAEVFPATAPRFSEVRVRSTGAPAIASMQPGDRDIAGPVFPGAWVGTVVVVTGADVTLRLPVQRVRGSIARSR